MSAGLLIGRAEATRLLRWWGVARGGHHPHAPSSPYPSTSLTSSPLPLPSPSAFPSSRPFSILRRERLYTRLSVPLSGLRSYLRHSAPTSSSSPPSRLCRYRRCITVRWRLLPPRDDPFRLAYRRARALSSTTTTITTTAVTTTTATSLRRPTLEKVMPRRRRDAARGSYFIPGGRSVATTRTLMRQLLRLELGPADLASRGSNSRMQIHLFFFPPRVSLCACARWIRNVMDGHDIPWMNANVILPVFEEGNWKSLKIRVETRRCSGFQGKESNLKFIY